MKFFLTGGAGFVGSHFVDLLIKKNHQVVVYDNLVLGSIKNLKHHYKNKNFKFFKGDILDFKQLTRLMKGCDVVIHLAANSDIIKSSLRPKIDLENGTLGTSNVLEAMRKNKIKRIIFTSSTVVYGEANIFPIKENYGPLFPISFYGASKLACEALISSYVHNFNYKAWIFRFANVVGTRTTHGVVLDFYNKIKKNTKSLEVLGNGKQSKPYILVDDIIDGMFYAFNRSKKNLNYFNLGTKGLTKVSTIAKEFLKIMNLKNTKIIYTGGKRGWTGDVSKVSLDINKIIRLGYKFNQINSNNALKKGLKKIVEELKLKIVK